MENSFKVKLGSLWFKYRGIAPLPVLFICCFWPSYDVKNFIHLFMFGLIIMFLGEAGRIWCVGFAGGITRTRTGDLHKLVTTGPFAYVRNPIYIFNIILYIGSAIILGVPQLIPLVILYFFIQYTFIVYYEEALLINSFKEAYVLYRTKVRRWIPSLYIKVVPSDHKFNLQGALVSEKRTFSSFFAVIIIAVIKFILMIYLKK